MPRDLPLISGGLCLLSSVKVKKDLQVWCLGVLEEYRGVLWHLAIIIPFISYTKLSKGRCAYSRAGRVWRELENLIEITVAREACRTLPPYQEKKGIERNLCQAALVAQMVKSPPAMQKTWVQSLGWEDPLEKRMATYSSILAWRIPWTEKPVGYSPWGLKESDTTE